MSSITRAIWTAALLLGLANAASALSVGDRVDDFQLLDEQGKAHRLHYHSNLNAIVIMTAGNGCPLARQYVPVMRDLRTRYGSKGVEFLLLDSNVQDTREAVAAEAAEFKFGIPVMVDDTQLIGEALGVKRTAEAFVVDTKTWKLAYRGPVDDRMMSGGQKPAATKEYLAGAIDAVLAGKPALAAPGESPGCIINLPERSKAPISYSKTVAPLLVDKCVACHHQGGVAPWAMSRYEMVKGFAPMIREVLRVKRMPPWHADPHYGSFTGDRSLTIDQTRTLVHWIESGAPRGEGSDPLTEPRTFNDDWQLGKPDLIIDVPAYNVPATGVVEYQYPMVMNPLQQDEWLRAVEVHPGAPEVVHHIIVGTGDFRRNNFLQNNGGALGGFSPGMPPMVLPPDTGVFFPKGGTVTFSMHYNPNGRAVTDRTKVGFYFHKTPPRYPMRGVHMSTFPLKIPPRAEDFTQTSVVKFDQPTIVYTVFFHAHLRGKAFRLQSIDPAGKRTTLVSVPAYDFRWQTSYDFKKPLELPRGSKLSLDVTWDNSSLNPSNPDPSRSVEWGEQSQQEMGVGWITVRHVGETLESWSRLNGITAAR